MFEIKRFLHKIDLFGQPIQLSFDRSPLQKSPIGGLLTILLLLLFSTLAVQSFYDIISKTHLNTSTTDNYEASPPFIDLSPYNMIWAISFNPPALNVWGNGSYFHIDVQQVIQTRDSSGKMIKNRTNMQLRPCNLGDFSQEAQKTLLDITPNVSTLLCPRMEDRYFLQGKYSSELFSYSSIKVSACQNSSILTCASQEQIDDAFSQGINFQFYFINNIININDLAQPLTAFLDDRIYVTIDGKKYQEVNYYFTENRIFTDQSFVQDDFQEGNKTFTYENNYDSSSVDLNNGTTYCGMYFRSNFISKYHTRTYDKIWKFISFVGGVWSICHLVFGIMGRSYNRMKLFLRISNELFDFSDEFQTDSKKTQQVLKENKITSKPKQNDPTKLSFSKKMEHNKIENDKRISGILNFNNPNRFKLRLGIKEFFVSLIRKKKETDYFQKQKALKSEAFLEINRHLDVVQLIRKMDEIEKLKDLFLNENQKLIFGISQKIKISLKNRKRESETFKKRLSYLGMTKSTRAQNKINDANKEMQKKYEAFLQLQEDKTSKKLNDKLIKLVGSQHLKFLEEMQKSPINSPTSKIFIFEKTKLKN